MSNSPLVTYTLLSPNRTHPRNHAIDTITIHCVVGQWTAETGCQYFAQSKVNAAPNYFVGKDGSIGLCVNEEDRSWCTGGDLTVNGITGKANDYRAVTIEVASDTTHPYAVTDAAYAALIRLVADIARRNGMGTLRWSADKSLVGKPEAQNMTVHRWFANKACPGEYLYTHMGDIAQRANEINAPQKEKTTVSEKERKETTMTENVSKEPADWAEAAWEKAKTKKGRDGKAIMDGTRPWDDITRQEVAVILDRLGLLEEGGDA